LSHIGYLGVGQGTCPPPKQGLGGGNDGTKKYNTSPSWTGSYPTFFSMQTIVSIIS